MPSVIKVRHPVPNIACRSVLLMWLAHVCFSAVCELTQSGDVRAPALSSYMECATQRSWIYSCADAPKWRCNVTPRLLVLDLVVSVSAARWPRGAPRSVAGVRVSLPGPVTPASSGHDCLRSLVKTY